MSSQTLPSSMPAARLHGPGQIRVDRVPAPGSPPPGHVLLQIEAVGICGSDLHTFRHARIGSTVVESPVVLGHEFAGIVAEVGVETIDGTGQPLVAGMRVAVDPAVPCGHCEWCRRGDPNLCPHHTFLGLWPDDGALRPRMWAPGTNCFPVPAAVTAEEATLLEPLGVALHAVDLAKLRVGQSAAVVGCGPIGLLVVQLLGRSGVSPLFAADPLDWRSAAAIRQGATAAFRGPAPDPARAILQATEGRGVDVAFEVAHGGTALETAAEVCAPGGRIVVVGIDPDDRLTLRHSVARRKGLTLSIVRRMKHTYPRSIQMLSHGRIDLGSLVSHRFPLAQAQEAFELNAAYAPGVLKVLICP